MNLYYTRDLVSWHGEIGPLLLDIAIILLIGMVSAGVIRFGQLDSTLLRFLSAAALTTALTLAYVFFLRHSRVAQIRHLLNI
jgi:hypothetical protein